MLVRDGQVIVRSGVRGIELDGFLPTIDGLAPQPALGDINAEVDLLLGIASCVSVRGRDREGHEHGRSREAKCHDR